MVRNRIKVLLAEAEITATTLVEKMPAGVDKVAMSYITNGRVLPTREILETMCDVFSCTPADIYEPVAYTHLDVYKRQDLLVVLVYKCGQEKSNNLYY